MNDLKIVFNTERALWELLEVKTNEVLDEDQVLNELTEAYPKALVILPRGA